MNNKEHNKTMRGIIALTGVTGTMFLYQNIIYPRLVTEKNLAVVYTASEDIDAGTKINEKMFNAHTISSSSVLPGMITDISKYKGYHLKGSLIKGEAVFQDRLQKQDVDTSQVYKIEVSSPYLSDVQAGDFIALYIKMNVDNYGTTIMELFPKKEILNPDYSFANDGTQRLYISASEEEMKKYYIAQTKGEIIAVKITALDEFKGELKSFEIDSSSAEDSSQVIEEEEDDNRGIIEYEIQDGDDLESLAVRFKTSTNKIKRLNNNKIDFEVGERIYVPA